MPIHTPRSSCAIHLTIVLLGVASYFSATVDVPAQGPDVCVPLPPAPLGTKEPPLAQGKPAGSPEKTAGVLEPLDPQAPLVYLRVRVAAQSTMGNELEYRMTVENCSSAPAHHVIVRDPLPANAKFVRSQPEPNESKQELMWRLGTLNGGAKREISLVLLPTGGDEIKNCARVQYEHGQCVATRLARPNLSLKKSGPSRTVLYDAVSYELALTNTGEAPLHNLLLTDVLPAGMEHESGKNRLSWIIGMLEPGEMRSVKFKVIAKSSGKLCNRAIATADGGFRKEIESCLEVTEAKVDLKMSGPKHHYLDGPATYRITVANQGTAELANAILDNPLPPQTTLINATPGFQRSGDRLRWEMGTLAPGTTRVFEIALKGQRIGEVCNRATVNADRGISQIAEVCTQFRGVGSLALEVKDLVDPVEVGDSTTYEIVVQNPGTKPATRVGIAATVPDQMEIIKAAGAPEHRVGQRITFDPVTLDPGAVIRYSIEVKARHSGDVRFKVELTADQLTSGPVLQEESTTIYASLPTSFRKSRRAEPWKQVGLAQSRPSRIEFIFP